MKKLIYTFAFVVMTIGVTAQTVVDIVVNSEDHNTLEAAVIAADLAGTLSGDGPFTVFAPTDAAFDALPAGTLDALLADPAGDLTDILLYHVVSGTILSTDLNDGDTAPTLLGPNITAGVGMMVTINGVNVSVADITASNGVVHVIDAVLTPPTVVDIVVDSPVHETLEAAVIAAELAGTLSGDGPFTVFAPTDDAFAALPAGTLDALLEDPSGTLTDILLYHVVGATALSTDLSDGDTFTTLLGDDIEVTITGGDVFINGAQVVIADILASNGVVHVIDAVLLPPTTTVVDIIVGSPDHETLEAAVIAADLAGALSGEGPFTVFAPTDAAFDALPAGLLDALLADPTGALTDILLYHVVGGTALSGDLNDGDAIATLFGPNVNVTIDMGTVFINGAEVVIADLEADNGVVHVIDAVLTPPTVVDIVVDSPVHETLEAAVIAAELAGTLSGDGPFTVFAPTDAAFDALPAGTLDALLADPTGALADILLYHVVGATALSTDLSDGDTFTTLLGEDIEVSITNGDVFINGAQVIIADILASNGVVHVIDAVLLPPTPTTTVVDIIVESPVHETLEAAVIAADLAGALSGDGPFTVFAPTDAAFAALPAGVLDALLADPSGALTDILLYHVVGASALSTDLNDGDALATLLGPNVNVTIDMGTVFINGAEVIVADLEADNGVVHVIDAVLTPPTVYDIIADSDIHNTLETAIDLAELDATLSGEGTFTVFAPTDAAFAALETAVLNEILADPAGTLTDYLLYHVVGSIAFAADLNDGDAIPTLFAPNEVVISIDGGVVSINGVATVTVADIQASNGVVHVIDAVLTPPTNVEDAAFGANLNVYPNPAVDQLTIAGELPVNARMFITDASGRIIMSDYFFGSRTVDVSSLESGMYFLSFRTESAVAVKTFIVE